jgi:hypothetical protein
MKVRFLLLSLFSATMTLLSASTAFADEPGADSVRTLPMITIYGKRPPLPSVVVEITRPTAAHEAGRAHDEMRNAWILASEPTALKNH